MTPEQAQVLHENRQKIDAEHDIITCWCCCWSCDFEQDDDGNVGESHEIHQ